MLEKILLFTRSLKNNNNNNDKNKKKNTTAAADLFGYC